MRVLLILAVMSVFLSACDREDQHDPGVWFNLRAGGDVVSGSR